MNLLQLENRIKLYEGHYNDDSAELSLMIRADLNEVYRSLPFEKIYPWWVRTDSLTPEAGGGTLLLPLDATFVLSITAPGAGMPMEPYDRQQQLEWAEEIATRGLTTYSLEGEDSTTGRMIVRFSPAANVVAHSVRIAYCPVELAADADIPDGPDPIMSNYIFWQTRVNRLLGDEERQGLVQQSQAQAIVKRRILDAFSMGTLSSVLPRMIPKGGVIA
jgi:hypothetical protein